MKDWIKTDWRKANSDIAKAMGVNMETVRRNRKRYAPESIPEKSDSQLKQATAQSAQRQGGRIKGLGEKLSQKFLAMKETHFTAKTHALISPSGEKMVITNIADFVRSHPQLFAAADTADRYGKNHRGEPTKLRCLAATQLQSVSAGSKKAWKGWVRQ